jgi:hypothetical protein
MWLVGLLRLQNYRNVLYHAAATATITATATTYSSSNKFWHFAS